MSEAAEFSDDISALWGRQTQPVFEPAPLRKPKSSRGADYNRVAILERDIQRLWESFASIEAADPNQLRRDFETALGREKVEMAAAVDSATADIDVRLSEQLSDLRSQISEVSASTARLLSELVRVELASRAGIARLEEAVEGHEAGRVGELGARKMGDELRAALDLQLSKLRAEAMSTTEMRVAEVEARLTKRLDGLAWQLRELCEHVGAVPSSPLPRPIQWPSPSQESVRP